MRYSVAFMLVVCFSGCLCCNTSEIPSELGEVDTGDFCQPPYIPMGETCCLDKDDDGLCDSQQKKKNIEPSVTTSNPLPTTTVITSSTTIQSTTTTVRIICRINSDCGEQIEELVCYRGDVYKQRITPVCKLPGTFHSSCIEKTTLVGQSLISKPRPIESCSQGCKNGKCL
jgi:hypothetical protein